MRFLADESCDAAVVRGLREAGHDVTVVAESSAGTTDQAVLQIALGEQRYPPAIRSRLPKTVVDIVAALREQLPGSFVVVTPAGARVSRLSPS